MNITHDVGDQVFFFFDAASQTFTSTTLTTVDDGTNAWQLTINDGQIWRARAVLFMNRDSTSDLKINWSNQPTKFGGRHGLCDLEQGASNWVAFQSDVTVGTGSGADPILYDATLDASGVTAATGPYTLDFQLAWNSSGSNITLYEYSFLTAERTA